MDHVPKWQAGKAQGVLVIQDVGGEDAVANTSCTLFTFGILCLFMCQCVCIAKNQIYVYICMVTPQDLPK